jgi:PAS domain S-box-containing protein
LGARASARSALRVLLVEDSENDALLLLRALRRGGYEPVSHRVWTAADLGAALAHEWDVVFCDYVMPGFNGPAAVRMIRERSADLPIVMVSGEVGEDRAVTAMRAGANDFVTKERLSRLIPALERELNESEARAARRSTEAALRETEARLQLLVAQLPVGIVVTDAAGQVTDVNPAALGILGSPSAEATKQFNVLHLPNLRAAGISALYEQALGGAGPLRMSGGYDSVWGRHSELQFDVVPLRDLGGATCGTITIIQDLTEQVRTERARRQSQERLESLINSLDGVVWEADPATFGFSFVSPQAERLLGYPVAQWLNEPGFWQSHLHPDDREHAVAACAEATAALRNHAIEYRMIAADGRAVWLRDRVAVVVEDGRAVRLRGILVDVSSQKDAEAALHTSEERFRALVEHSREAITLLDADGVLLYSSPANRDVLGGDPDAAIGRSVLSAIHPDDAHTFGAVLARPGVPISGMIRARHADGSWRWIEGTGVNLLHDPNVGAIVVNFRDVTERKRAQDEIERFNRELERRVVERTAEIEAANRELQAFSSSVSHDLRTPLRAVDGFAAVLLEDHAAELSPPARQYLERIRAASRRMGELIDELLTLSRVAQTALNREPVDLSQLARAIAAELQQAQPRREVTVEVADGLIADADPALMRVVLENLLGNAWKYTGRHPQARIAFDRVVQGGAPVFLIRDDGAGFDMSAANRLFEPFQRLHDPAEFDGTGIGLATVQRIIRRHGGRVWAEGALEAGATFYFTLCADEPMADREPI